MSAKSQMNQPCPARFPRIHEELRLAQQTHPVATQFGTIVKANHLQSSHSAPSRGRPGNSPEDVPLRNTFHRFQFGEGEPGDRNPTLPLRALSYTEERRPMSEEAALVAGE